LQPGLNVLDFEAGQVPLSRAIEVLEIAPSRVELVVDLLLSKNVAVKADLEVQLHRDYELKEKTIIPEMVTVRGPQAIVEPIEVIRTKTIKVDEERPQKWEGSVGLVLPGEVEAIPAKVDVHLLFGEKVEEKWIRAGVRVPELEGRSVQVRPERVRLLLQMPVSMARERLPPEQVGVVLENLELLEQGEHHLSYRVMIPPGSVLLRAEPELIQVVIVERKQ
jgi:YbbR domain-containing protein